MKIALVNDSMKIGNGADHVLYEVAKRIGAMPEHEVFVLANECEFEEDNFTFIPLKIEKLYTGKLLKDINFFGKMRRLKSQVKKLQQEHEFDIFNVHHLALGKSFVCTGKPVVVTCHGTPLNISALRTLFIKHLEKTNNLPIIAISNYMSDQISSPQKFLIYNGVDRNIFKPLSPSVDKGYMFYCGRLVPHKGVMSLIFLSRDIDYPLIIAGTGTSEQEELLKYTVKKFNAPVTFLGKVTFQQLIKRYQECSFFVSASEWEGFGLPFLEANLCGKPVIGLNTSAIPEVIKNNESGYIVKNLPEMIDFARTLSTNPSLRNELGKKSIKWANQFDWNVTAKKYLDAFKELTTSDPSSSVTTRE